MGQRLPGDFKALILAKITEAFERGLSPDETLEIVKSFLRERESAAVVVPFRSRAGK